MCSPVNRLAALTWALLFIAASAAGADETDEREAREAEKGRWGWSLALTSGITINEQKGTTLPSVQIVTGPIEPLPPNAPIGATRPLPAPFASPLQSRVDAVSPYVGANFEVLTPALEIIPSAPRFFGAAEILPTFAPKRTVAAQGAATEFIFPRGFPDQLASNQFPEQAISGPGTRLEAEVMTTVFAASLGAAWDFEFRKRLLRIKPSVGWIRWGVIVEGRALDAFKDDIDPVPAFQPFFGEHIRLVEINGRGSGFFNAIGPGLELEVELAKRGPIRPIVFLGGFAYRVVGNQTIVFSGAQTFDDALGEATYNATWVFEVQPWVYRAGAGIRFRWVGF